MEVFGQEVKSKAEFPSEKIVKLRSNLIQEELDEFNEALKNKDLKEVADALTDILYVTYGAGHAFGIDLDKCFEEVQRSNMSKACVSVEEAEKTIEWYKKNKDTDCFYEEKGGKFLIYRKSDRKTLKSINYSPAKLKDILED